MPTLAGDEATGRPALRRWPAGALTALALAAGILGACATAVTVTPQLPGAAPACQIRASVAYDGNPAYLPGALVPAADSPQGTVLRYSYESRYGLDQLPAPVALVNPLMLVGFPEGSNSLVLSARLDVLRAGTPIRSYAAAAAMKRTSTMFSEGETLSDMRRRALLLVRDNISAQICRDQETLARLLSGQ